MVIFLVYYCALTFSQNIVYTRIFDTKRSNVPLMIINNHPNYFYLLRYDKKGHDFDLERRAKQDGKMLAFTPLRLESINANWFNFENLEYQLLELNGKIYFIFEKAENSHHAIYLKTIDTSGTVADFKELASISRDKTMSDSRFIFSLTAQNKLLIIGEQYYNNSTVKKMALLYDPEKNENLWIKKLPLENPYTGYSREFKCSANNDLFYVLTKSYILSYKRKNVSRVQLSVPVFSYDSLTIVSFLNGEKMFTKKPLLIKKPFDLKNISLVPFNNSVTAMVHFAKQENPGDDSIFFLIKSFKSDLSEILFTNCSPLNAAIAKRLTFYDGTDYDGASDKDYTACEQKSNEDFIYDLSERKEESYYKELLLFQSDLKTGKMISQQIIPRKIFYFPDRTPFKNIGLTTQLLRNKNFYCFVLEDNSNVNKTAEDFNFHKFSTKTDLWGGNLISYCLKENGSLEKKIIYKSNGFDFVPLKYSSNQNDFIFYLNNEKTERFGFLDLKNF